MSAQTKARVARTLESLRHAVTRTMRVASARFRTCPQPGAVLSA